MKPSVQRLLERYYPVQPNGKRLRDTNRIFYNRLVAEIPPTAIVLSVGAGPTPEPWRRLLGRFARLVGTDPDPVVLTNADLDEAHVNNGIDQPFADQTFDAAYSDWTVEHVAQPVPFLREINRVLKPGAAYYFRTTNRLDYMTLVSSHTPHWFHRLIANRVRAELDAHEPWPVHYRMNRAGTIRRSARAADFVSVDLQYLEPEPVYLRFSTLAFQMGVALRASRQPLRLAVRLSADYYGPTSEGA